jgi:hypothetical protein
MKVRIVQLEQFHNTTSRNTFTAFSEYNSAIFRVVNCSVLRDLERDVERNEIIEKCAQLTGEAAQRTPMRAMWENKKAIHKRVKDILFTRKDFLTTVIGQVSW